MSRSLVAVFILYVLSVGMAAAQIPDGSEAPDFTFTDINGKTQNLYSYLDKGMYVALDVSATWCEPCWDYTSKGIMDSLYQKYDEPGSKTWKVMFMEADGTTDSADLYGTGGNTRGNWVGQHKNIIMDPPAGPGLRSFLTAYDVGYFPTLFLICPDKKVYHDTLNKGTRAKPGTWAYVATQMCGTSGAARDNSPEKLPAQIYPNPVTGTLIINLAPSLGQEVKCTLYNSLGQGCNPGLILLSQEQNKLVYDVSKLQPGVYYCTVSGTKNISRTIPFVKY